MPFVQVSKKVGRTIQIHLIGSRETPANIGLSPQSQALPLDTESKQFKRVGGTGEYALVRLPLELEKGV